MTRMNPAVTILLSIITIGIFSLVWQWNTCTSLKKLKCGDCKVICPFTASHRIYYESVYYYSR